MTQNAIFDIDDETDDDIVIKDYDIVSSPNDFNVLSYFNFIERGKVKIPAFQRHYVWDIRRASKLIESLIIGLPIPQIFLYESSQQEFQIIDGQQRLMTIYYFIKGKFPKRDSRGLIRKIIDVNGRLSDADFDNDDLFMPFKLSFNDGSDLNKLNGATYNRLDGYRDTFDMRTIRNIVVKQVKPDDDNSSVFELFNRLNTGGINLGVQEIRMSMYHSKFLSALVTSNDNEKWRQVLGGQPDQRQRDVEILLRMIALAYRLSQFSKPLSKFLNKFANDAKNGKVNVVNVSQTLEKFFNITNRIERDLYLDSVKRFSVTLLESLFFASCHEAVVKDDPTLVIPFSASEIVKIKSDPKFSEYFSGKTTDVDRLKGRMAVAAKYIK